LAAYEHVETGFMPAAGKPGRPFATEKMGGFWGGWKQGAATSMFYEVVLTIKRWKISADIFHFYPFNIGIDANFSIYLSPIMV
jgi:hypothetical protein